MRLESLPHDIIYLIFRELATGPPQKTYVPFLTCPQLDAILALAGTCRTIRKAYIQHSEGILRAALKRVVGRENYEMAIELASKELHAKQEKQDGNTTSISIDTITLHLHALRTYPLIHRLAHYIYARTSLREDYVTGLISPTGTWEPRYPYTISEYIPASYDYAINGVRPPRNKDGESSFVNLSDPQVKPISFLLVLVQSDFLQLHSRIDQLFSAKIAEEFTELKEGEGLDYLGRPSSTGYWEGPDEDIWVEQYSKAGSIRKNINVFSSSLAHGACDQILGPLTWRLFCKSMKIWEEDTIERWEMPGEEECSSWSLPARAEDRNFAAEQERLSDVKYRRGLCYSVMEDVRQMSDLSSLWEDFGREETRRMMRGEGMWKEWSMERRMFREPFRATR